jgi:nucleotide-binding universal stress UspA family protein
MFKSIVVGTDGSDTAKKAVSQAIDLAKTFGATLHIVAASQPVATERGIDSEAQPTASSQDALDAVLGRAREQAAEAGLEYETYPRIGNPADALLDVAEERDADLIVVGNKGMTGAKRFLLGSVPNKVSHHAPCSVLIIRTT